MKGRNGSSSNLFMQVSSMIYLLMVIILYLLFIVSRMLRGFAQKRHGNSHAPAWLYSKIQPCSACNSISQQLNSFISLLYVQLSGLFQKVSKFFSKKLLESNSRGILSRGQQQLHYNYKVDFRKCKYLTQKLFPNLSY